MYTPDAIRQIVRVSINLIGLWSPGAEELMIGTIAKESHNGKWLRQVGGGPARGICQVEPSTSYDNWHSFLRYRDELRYKVTAATGVSPITVPNYTHLEYDPIYNIIMARIWYYRQPTPLPASGDLIGQAHYWNNEYNCNNAHGTPQEYLDCWQRFVVQS